jgi:CheY-like chemotaxis protein
VEPEEQQALKELGAAGVLAKPFSPMSLAKQVQEILDAC